MNIDQIIKKSGTKRKDQGDLIFALDIGTRTVVGIVGEQVDDKYYIRECVSLPHTKRAMVDGQVEDIKQVAKIVGDVKKTLETRLDVNLTRACIAAAGRALRTVNISREYSVSDSEVITEEMVSSMEMETIAAAQAELDSENRDNKTLFYCVGHNIVNYHLDDYKIISLVGHKGERASIDMVVAFLPGIVVEGLYSVMDLVKLEVQSLTLEPIAAMNVIIPQEIRLINIALVDIGAGTSDIAIAKEGAIVAYAMATTAGDEITEEIIRAYLVDFATAEQMKCDADDCDIIEYKDIFGFPHELPREDFLEQILPCVDVLAQTICSAIVNINGEPPQAVFLVGGGSLTKGLTTLVADKLGLDENRVAVGSYQFLKDVETGGLELGAEYITPIGIGVTAANDAGYDFSVITINDKKIRVFDTKQLTVFELLSLAGFKSSEVMGHSGQGLTYTLNGNHATKKGTMMIPAEIKVNNHPASLTTAVTQGDNVKLVPAKNGENAHAKLSDVIDFRRYRKGTAHFGGQSVKFGLNVSVNGVLKEQDYEIQPLDDIVTGGILTLGDLLDHLGIEYSSNIIVNGQPQPQEYLLCDEDKVLIRTSVPETAPVEASAPDVRTDQAAAGVPNVPASVAAVIPITSAEEVQTITEPVQKIILPPLTLTLNDRRIMLPQDPSGRPHTFLELLNYTDIDPKNPQGEIELTLNGNNARFTDPLEEGDVAVIRWKKA